MRTLDVQAFIDEQGVTRTQLWVLTLCTAMMFIDGFDVFMIGKLAPAIAAGFGETPAAMTSVFLFQQIGLAIGAFAMGPIADRFGRKRTLVFCTLCFSLMTFGAVFTRTLGEFALLRGLAGVFLSGVVPNASALMTELSPRRRRSSFLSILFVGYSAGGGAGALVAAFLLDRYGWHSGFWIGGLVPLFFLPFFIALVPESVQFLCRRNATDRRIARTLSQMRPDMEFSDTVFVSGEPERAGRSGPVVLFADGRIRATALIWTACFLSMGNIALLGAWMATFFQELGGISIQRFALVSMVTFAGGILGTLTVGFFMDKFRPSRVLSLFFLGNACTLVAITHAPFGTVLFAIALTLNGFFQSAGQAGLNAIVANAYPTSARATGFAWAGGAGRIGGIISPVLGGLAVASHLSLQAVFALIALPPLGVIVTLVLLDRAQRRRAEMQLAAA